MTIRIKTRLLIIFRRLARRPLPAVTLLFILLGLILSFFFYLFEQSNPPYDSYFGALKGILVLIISGFDVDPQPQTLGALLCSYLLMIVGILYIAFITANITAGFVQSALMKGITMGKIKFENHILICGWVNNPLGILEQLLAPDLKEHRPIVIIDPNIDSAPIDHPLVKTIRGEPTETAILEQANVAKAHAAIILADCESGDANAADARSLQIAIAVETFQPDIKSCVEVLNPENVKHFERVEVDEVIPVSEIGNQLVVQAALNPGVSRLIMDMLTFGEGEEIYECPVPPAFVGRTFTDLASCLMQTRAMVAVGVSSNDKIVNSHRSRHRFQEGDRVFILAEDEPTGLENLLPQRTSPARGN